MMKRIVLVTWIILTCVFHLRAQELPRRVYLGIRMENLTDDAKKLMGIQVTGGILISEVLKGSTAEKAGFMKGDVLTKINNRVLSKPEEVLKLLTLYKTGETFSYELVRNKKGIKGKAVFKPYPQEFYPDLEMVYTQSTSDIGKQRIIISKPKKAGKKPLIVFIGGIGCYSLDLPLDTARAEVQLLNYLSRSGFVCARIEKPGMGDNANYCKPCKEVSFIEELNGYIHAIRLLKQNPEVDSNRVFIFGHSMGGVFAPMIAQKEKIQGVMAYGTLGSNFIEYLAKTRRTIAEAYQMNPAETDQLIKDFCECSSYYFVEKLSTEQAAEKKQICREYLGIFDLRSRAYNNELYELNIPSLWSTFDGSVLLLWGASDYIAAREDHEIIFSALQFYAKSKPDFKIVKQTDHAMNYADSFSASVRNSKTYNPETGTLVLNWLNTVMNP